MSERGFLGRWSGRKRAAREEERREADRTAGEAGAADERADAEDAGGPPEQAVTGAEEPAAEEPISEEELARLPSVEEAESSADLRPYLRRGVPPELRRAALRRMWSLNPAIRDYVDPALDYAWDFNAPATGQATAAAGVASLLGAAVRDVALDRIGDGRGGPSRAASRQETPGGRAIPHPEPPPEGTSPHQSAAAPGPAEPRSGPRRRHGGAVPRTPPGGAGGGPDGTSDGV
jgi:hypothetical protein